MPITMEEFLDQVKNSSREGAVLLHKQWLLECSEIINERRDAVEEWMGNDAVWSTAYFIFRIIIFFVLVGEYVPIFLVRNNRLWVPY